MTLERIGITEASTYAAAARAAAALNGIRSPEWRRIAVAEFQSAVALIDRAVTMGGLDRKPAHDLVVSLAALPILIERGYDTAFAEWLRRELVPALPLQADASDPIEDAGPGGLCGTERRSEHDGHRRVGRTAISCRSGGGGAEASAADQGTSARTAERAGARPPRRSAHVSRPRRQPGPSRAIDERTGVGRRADGDRLRRSTWESRTAPRRQPETLRPGTTSPSRMGPRAAAPTAPGAFRARNAVTAADGTWLVRSWASRWRSAASR